MRRRVMVIGLDCAPPVLVFDRYRDVMPNVARLMETGTWGPLRSTIPPITVPAWVSMVCGRDPGELGLYGFRNRQADSYELALPTSKSVWHKRLWDVLGENGHRVASMFVPLTHPPTPVRGHMVSCFLTPGDDAGWGFPRGLEQELRSRFGPYRPDVEGFRGGDAQRILRELYETGEQHFAMARHVWAEKRPDFLMMVEMGSDRFHHAFWHRIDPAHPRFTPGFEEEGRRYYAFLDAQVGSLLEMVDDNTTVMVVSDHGARSMEGGVCINEWLRREGWLTLLDDPDGTQPLRPDLVDWSKTRAWGEGGYYARVFLNVEGREPEGVIPARSQTAEREHLAQALLALPAPDGQPMGTRVVVPEQTYGETLGSAPDLMVFFGDLRFRSIGTVGGGAIHVDGNDRGPDGCNHDWDGVFVMAGGEAPARGHTTGLEIYDVGRTVLGLFDVSPPAGWRGRDLSVR